MKRPPRGYGRLQHRIRTALLEAADAHDVTITVRQTEVLTEAAVRAAKCEMVPDTPMRCRPGGISDQQLRCITGAANGLTNEEIAAHLGVHIDTVKTHLLRYYRIVGANGRAHGVALALCLGLVSLDDLATPSTVLLAAVA